MGFKTIICNRPDGEAPEQPDFQAISNAAIDAGLNVHHIPVVPGGIDTHDIRAFSLALSEMPKPIFAYCRTGTRSAALWALTAATSGEAVATVLSETANAGYDLEGMKPLLDECAASGANG
jgi:sulfide:quinone oxidoreductase